jgi:hypothetical protein
MRESCARTARLPLTALRRVRRSCQSEATPRIGNWQKLEHASLWALWPYDKAPFCGSSSVGSLNIQN